MFLKITISNSKKKYFRKLWLILIVLVFVFTQIHAQNGWTKKAGLPTPRACASACVFNDKIYVMGGETVNKDLSVNEVYFPLTDTWETKQPMPTPRGGLLTCFVNDTIYALGGGNFQYTDKNEAYNPVTDSWMTKANLPLTWNGVYGDTVDGIIYIMGGHYNRQDCFAYDPINDQWTQKTPIPSDGCKGTLSATAYNGLIYTFGGVTNYPMGPMSTVNVYNPKTDTWESRAKMPTTRYTLRTFLVDGKIYAIGGSQGIGNSLSTVEVYDPINDSWEKLPDMPFKVSWFTGAVFNNKIYVFGGTPDWNTEGNEVWEYDPAFQIQNKSFIFEKNMRDYTVFLPKNYNGSTKMPVVFNLHGYTLDKDQQMNYSQMNKVADTAGFMVVYPNAVDAAWNCGVSFGPSVDDVGFIDALIDTLSVYYSIDKTRIYCCGLSRGGFMSNRLACELSDRIAAVAAVAGTMAKSIANNCIPDRHVPILYFHGTDDPIVPYNGDIERLAADTFINHWIQHNLCTESDTIMLPNLDTLDGCTVQKITHTNCSDSTKVIFYKILNGGHTWPGGNPTYLIIPGYNLGNTNFDINASEIMWDFFKNYRLFNPTFAEDNRQFPIGFSLSQNYPNPFNPSTTIKYSIPKLSFVTLKVYDILGKEVSTLINEEKPAGIYQVEFKAANLPSGVYFYSIRAGKYVETKKMILMK